MPAGAPPLPPPLRCGGPGRLFPRRGEGGPCGPPSRRRNVGSGGCHRLRGEESRRS